MQYPSRYGLAGFYAQIRRARSSIDMEMYELSDYQAEQALVAAASRGVRVRVLLDRDFSGGSVNQSAAHFLRAHGVMVRWAPASYIFHIKVTAFDDKTADISSGNLVAKYYATSRDATVVDRDALQVSAIERTFAKDWVAGGAGIPAAQTVQAPGLVWSPDTNDGTAESALVSEIDSAQTSIDFESEELSDPAIYQALAADAERGVNCRIVMTNSSEWDTAFTTLIDAGCQVHILADSASVLYIHEKLILDDAGTSDESLLIGSQNASVTSLTRNRELSVVLTALDGGSGVISSVSSTFGEDFDQGTAWGAPATTTTTTTTEPVPPPTSTIAPAPPVTTTTPPVPAPGACFPLSSAGNCYEPGEYCSDADHGMSGVAGDGETIVCEENDGWRWEPV